MRRRLTTARIALATALWPIPTFGVVLAVVLAIVLRRVDLLLQARWSTPVAWLFGGDASAARSLLSTVATSLASITTLLFSLTIVTLQLASTQYSPRLLQTFSRDRVVQSCLALLLGTYVYCLIVLRNVRSAGDGLGIELVPRLSITLALVLTLASVGALVAFVGHQVKELRVETMMLEVHAESQHTARRLEDGRRRSADGCPQLPASPTHARRVFARDDGFLQNVRHEPLVRALAHAEATLVLTARPGEAVIAGTPIGWVWSDRREAELDVAHLEDVVREALVVGFERIEAGDPSYGLRKLVDIAVRALSPGINDPTTAVHALSHISALLGQVAVIDSWDRQVSDEHGQNRLFLSSWDVEALVDIAVTQIQFYGRDDPTVTSRLLDLLEELAWRVTTSRQRATVLSHRASVEGTLLARLPIGWSAEDVGRRCRAIDDAVRSAAA